MQQTYFVYKLTNTTNGKFYIGASVNPANRLYQHRSDARRGSETYLHKAMRKYGVDGFTMEIIHESQSEQDMFDAEIRLIQEHRSNERGIGYNLSAGGEGKSMPQSEDTKKLLSEVVTKAWASKSSEEMDAFREKMRDVGADISAETRQKRSDAAKAQHSDTAKKSTHKAAASKANQDPEKRRLIAEKAKARWADPEFVAKMKAKNNTPEAIEKKRKAAAARYAAKVQSA